MNKKKKILVIGSSRGIGEGIVNHFSSLDHEVFGVSRSPSQNCKWIEGDISTAEGIQELLKKIDNISIDALIFSSGTWEEYGFMEEFDFLKTSDSETRHIMSVNLIAPIEITKGLVVNLSNAENPRAIYLGALSGLDNLASNQVAYSASKFGLRGAIQSLGVSLKKEGIGFTVINPGNVGTPEVLDDIKEGRFKQQIPIPMSDVISSIELVLSLSNSVDIGDIDLIQKSN